MAERREEADRGHVTVADSNRRWATDLTTVWTRQDGVVALVPVIDCGDRFCFPGVRYATAHARVFLCDTRSL